MEKEILDFCRVKKIFDKGFGFLSSINYPQDVFFHFSKIKDQKIREELEKLKRGVVYIYYTSRVEKNKRKVSRLWLDLTNVPGYLIQGFKIKIIDELNNGKTNAFELAYIIRELNANNHIERADFELVLNSKKIQSNPSIVIQMLNEEYSGKFEDIEDYFKKIKNGNNKYWSSDVLSKIYS